MSSKLVLWMERSSGRSRFELVGVNSNVKAEVRGYEFLNKEYTEVFLRSMFLGWKGVLELSG